MNYGLKYIFGIISHFISNVRHILIVLSNFLIWDITVQEIKQIVLYYLSIVVLHCNSSYSVFKSNTFQLIEAK